MSRSYRKPWFHIEAMKTSTVKKEKRLANRIIRRANKQKLYKELSEDIENYSMPEFKKEYNLDNAGLVKVRGYLNKDEIAPDWYLKSLRK
jgi:hypothetical protein